MIATLRSFITVFSGSEVVAALAQKRLCCNATWSFGLGLGAAFEDFDGALDGPQFAVREAPEPGLQRAAGFRPALELAAPGFAEPHRQPPAVGRVGRAV